MSMDLTGITNQNEYYTNHYFSSIFEENAAETISKWRAEAKDNQEIRTPWAKLRDASRQYYPIHNRFLEARFGAHILSDIRTLADIYLSALGYPEAKPEWIDLEDETRVPVYLELKKPNGTPALWVLLATSEDKEEDILDKRSFSVEGLDEVLNGLPTGLMTEMANEDLVTKILFGQKEPPRFVILIGMNEIALIDRNKWNEKRYLEFDLTDIFGRREESTLQAMAVLLHRESLCPEEGSILLDELDANSQRHAAGVSQDLKYALRESIELLGNEVLYDLAHRQGRDLNADPVDAGELTIQCLRYMYRMLFVLFIEARPELGYAPIKAQSYLTGYSLESLRDIADNIRDDISEVGEGFFLHETLSKLYDLIYNGYPETEEELLKYSTAESIHDMFVIAPLKAHIFDPEFTRMINEAKLRNRVMLRIIDLMSLTRETGRRNDRRGRISYANLGINQMGSVYEALLSYRGFIAEHDLYEVKRAGDSFNELDVGYFVAEEELEQYIDLSETYSLTADSEVDIPALRRNSPRLDLAARIAEQNHFMHWELEFADLFADRGGFDLIIGNPPWIKLEWKEQNVLADRQPMFAIREFNATRITTERAKALTDSGMYRLYLEEYTQLDGMKAFFNSLQNYTVLKGQQSDLYKCFLPQAWYAVSKAGTSAFVHPNTIFEDSKGNALREALYPRLRRNYRFVNELKLFSDVHHETKFGLSIYGPIDQVHFDLISKLYDPSTIDACYDNGSRSQSIQRKNGWIISGSSDRIIHVEKKELSLFARLLEGNDKWKNPRLPDIYSEQLIKVLELFADYPTKLGSDLSKVFTTECWHETNDQNNGFIKVVKKDDGYEAAFPETMSAAVYSAPNIASLNPYGSCTRSTYRVNSDYDRVDLTEIPENYMIRCKYRPGMSMDQYLKAIPESPWGKVTEQYRIVSREFVGCDSERTLTCAIAPRAIAHVHAVFSACIKNCMDMACLAGCEASVPYDFFVKCIGKRHINYSTYMLFPLLDGEKNLQIVSRTLMMNCLSVYYSDLWKSCWHEEFTQDRWSKDDPRLAQSRFTTLTEEWNWDTPMRSDYERRQALVELDTLVAIALGMTLEQLKTIYRIQFPVLQSYEADTWYDANGRIVFTNNRGLTGVGFSRPEWENGIKGAPAGQKFYRTISDDTMPGGPVERTIEYVAPFDRCDREKDYETAWKFFEEKYGKR